MLLEQLVTFDWKFLFSPIRPQYPLRVLPSGLDIPEQNKLSQIRLAAAIP
jgi:hypothetical protein